MPGRSLVTLFLRNRALRSVYFLILLCIPLSAAAGNGNDNWKFEETHSDSREFAAGGKLHVQMSVGDMHIHRGDSTRISLRYTVKSRHERNVKESRVDFDVHGSDATIEFYGPRSNTQFDVDLEVPQNTDLEVHGKVGDMTVEDVQGNKDLSLGVGDIRVSKDQSGYQVVRASTGIGDVNGDGYGETSGWLGKTLKYRGEGKYELRAHVGVGDITLEGK